MEKVYKVVRKEKDAFVSVASPEVNVVGQKILVVSAPLTYKLNKWTEALPESLGIFVFDTPQNAEKWIKSQVVCYYPKYILECAYKGELQPIHFALTTPFPPIFPFIIREKEWYKFQLMALFFKKWSRFLEFEDIGSKFIYTPKGTYVVKSVRPIKIIKEV